MKCIQLLGTRRCENNAIPGSNYCPAHALAAIDSSGGEEAGRLYSRNDEHFSGAVEAPCPTEDEAGDPPSGVGTWTPGSSKL